MMDVKQSYNIWARHYDSDINKTRDVEAFALKDMLSGVVFKTCLEIGCGTGKNTGWLASRAQALDAVDFSEEMLDKARKKIKARHVAFHLADITQPWNFSDKQYALITFSLVLEHVDQLGPVFKQAARNLESSGFIYIGELHPFKQYAGTKARFETETGQHVITCFNHHISDFHRAASSAGLSLLDMNEYFDADDRAAVPRILAMVFKKA